MTSGKAFGIEGLQTTFDLAGLLKQKRTGYGILA